MVWVIFFFLVNCADLTDKIDIGLDIVDFINYNKNSWSKTSNALPIIFCCKMCLFWVFFILQKSCNIISLGFFYSTSRSTKVKNICFAHCWFVTNFYDLNYKSTRKGWLQIHFWFFIFSFFGKGDYDGVGGRGLRWERDLYKTNQFLLWSLVVHI